MRGPADTESVRGELAAPSEFRTAFFACSKSGSRRIVLDLERLGVFFRRAILAASYAAFSMVIHSKAPGLEARFWPTSGLPEYPTGMAQLHRTKILKKTLKALRREPPTSVRHERY